MIPISERLHPAELAERLQDLGSLCGTLTEFTERLLAFDSLCEARARATKRRGPNKKSKNERTRFEYAEIQEPSDLVCKLQLQ